MSGLGLLLRALHTGCAVLLPGTLMLLQLCPEPAAPARWRSRWAHNALRMAAALVVLGFALLALQAASLQAEQRLGLVARRLLLESHFGSVWLARQGFALMSLVLLLGALRSAKRWMLLAAGVTSGLALALAPLSGHSAALEPSWPMLLTHSLHLLAAAAWWGALPALADLLLESWRDGAARPLAAATRTLSRFSAAAVWLMLAIVASGASLALAQVERWPALLGTPYGQLLMTKVLLLVGVLILAARLRWRLLPGLLTSPERSRARQIGRWIAAECTLALLIVLAAAALSQTVPARHDAIEWRLPFRLSVEATWDLPWVPLRVGAGAVVVLGAGVLAAAALLGTLPRSRGFAAAAALAGGGALLALQALSVDAYPDTYRRPSVAYQTISVATGADLFTQHCVSCHGHSGHGDGILARSLPRPPADLTQPHTALHTAGDLFWWLTHGKPPGVMPGFEDRLSEDDRWDLVNFLRTLSAGYQARILTDQVVAGRPWLPAVDFNMPTAQASLGTLKDLRGRSAVLLVLFSWPQSRQRLQQLVQQYPRIRASSAELVAVPIGAAPGISAQPFPILTDGADETVRTYALLRRTLSDADSREERPVPPHMELLIDRYGYVRARWRPDEGPGWSDGDALVAQLALLRAEPQLRPPPEDHVH